MYRTKIRRIQHCKIRKITLDAYRQKKGIRRTLSRNTVNIVFRDIFLQESLAWNSMISLSAGPIQEIIQKGDKALKVFFVIAAIIGVLTTALFIISNHASNRRVIGTTGVKRSLKAKVEGSWTLKKQLRHEYLIKIDSKRLLYTITLRGSSVPATNRDKCFVMYDGGYTTNEKEACIKPAKGNSFSEFEYFKYSDGVLTGIMFVDDVGIEEIEFIRLEYADSNEDTPKDSADKKDTDNKKGQKQ